MIIIGRPASAGLFFVNNYMNITLLAVLVKIADLTKYVIEKFTSWKRSRKIKKEYDQIKKDVKEGNIDNINDRLR